ncbi:MAG: glutathione S-transferase N-terminal domain-containing protein [Kordiimonadaceae bacterium]|nr:glutathione S-transferase N-terminal domain-containing protein [Kordiimonadaceae bacterium]
MIKLYQLCGENQDAGFGPFAWRAKLCLMHKGLDFEEIMVQFADKSAISHADPATIPVLDDGDMTVSDSLAIAKYLEKTYPAKSLFGGSIGEAQAVIMNRWVDMTLIMGMFPMFVLDIHSCLDAASMPVFRESREKRLGAKLEDVAATRDSRIETFRASLAPLRAGLEDVHFLSGDKPAWLDYCVFGTFMWARTVSAYDPLDEGDVLYAWRERMLDLFGGTARKAARAYV